ncbi:MAG: hypothetical protein ACOC7K_00015 [bacterium]
MHAVVENDLNVAEWLVREIITHPLLRLGQSLQRLGFASSRRVVTVDRDVQGKH